MSDEHQLSPWPASASSCHSPTSREIQERGHGPEVGVRLSGDHGALQHYCRGCGQELPLGFRGHFHRACLRVDKRNRTNEQRRQEQERFRRWSKKLHCPSCGAAYSDQRSGGPIEASCEASRPAQRRETQVGCGSASETDVRAGERG